MPQLNGQTALVTGGSRGIGAAIARRLAADGAAVAITYTQAEQQAQEVVRDIEAAGGRGLAIRADNRAPAAIEAAVSATAEAFGSISILVNNAGIFDARPITELTLADFDRTVDINVRAVFAFTRAALAHMPDGGRIITIGSNLAQRVPWPGLSLYSLSKAALIGFTKGLARDLGPRAISVSIVHPGSTATDMNPDSGELADLQRSTMAIPRYNDPAEVASLIAWLAGPEGRGVTGAEFTIDAGTNA